MRASIPGLVLHLAAHLGLHGRIPGAALYGSDSNAEVAGDVAILADEVTPVLKALRATVLDVVASGEPTVYLLHYWGTGPVDKLAGGF